MDAYLTQEEVSLVMYALGTAHASFELKGNARLAERFMDLANQLTVREKKVRPILREPEYNPLTAVACWMPVGAFKEMKMAQEAVRASPTKLSDYSCRVFSRPPLEGEEPCIKFLQVSRE